MDFGFAMNVIRTGVFYVLIIASPILLIGMGVGLIISIFQATTSIQEQTLTFVPKIAAVLLSFMFFGPWMFRLLIQFTINLLNQIPMVVR